MVTAPKLRVFSLMGKDGPVTPREPTPEALREAACEYLDDWFGLQRWPPVHRLPDLLVGFAEQRVAAVQKVIEAARALNREAVIDIGDGTATIQEKALHAALAAYDAERGES